MHRVELNSCLQNVVVLKSGRDGDLFCEDQRVLKIFIRNVMEFLAMP